MGDVRREHWSAVVFVLGGWLLASCTLVDRYGLGEGDAGAVAEAGNDEPEPLSEHEGGDLRSGAGVDAAVPSPGSGFDQDAGVSPERDADAEAGGLATPGGAFPGASGRSPDGRAEPDRGRADAGAFPTDTQDAGPAAPVDREPDAGQGGGDDAGAPPEDMDDAGAPPEDMKDAAEPVDEEAAAVSALLDAVLAEAAKRVEMYCRCPANAMECSREGFGDESCLEEGLNAASGVSDDGVRELLACWLPAEEAYTNCIARELDCEAVQASIRPCTREHKRATDRCNEQSLVATSVRLWCGP